MEEIRARVAEFRKMAAFADQLEDAGDDRRALAVRIALYDRVEHTAMIVKAEIEAKFGGEDGMTRAASADGNEAMTREAQWYKTLWRGVKGLGKGLWDAIAHGKTPGVVHSLGKSTSPMARSVGEALTRPGARNMLSPLGRGLAIGVPAAGALGAGALALRGRGDDRKPDGGYETGPSGYPAGPAVLPPSGMPSGPMGGPMPSGSGPMIGGGGGYGGGPTSGGGGGVNPAELQGMMSAVHGMEGRLGQLEARVGRLESGGR